MKRSLIALIIALCMVFTLPAADHHDISLSFGHSMYKWPEKGISFSYGVNIGLSARWEMNIWGISEAVPLPFGSNMFGVDFTCSLLGPRSTASKVAGTGLNMLLSVGGFYRTDNNGAGPIVSITPLIVGSPISGRRERILKTGVGYDAVNNEVVVTFSLINLDFYVRGTYRDYIATGKI